MDLEVIENISTNGTFDPDASYHVYRNHHLDTLLLLFGLGSIAASIVVLFIMRRYDILHTRTNAYVNSICISNIMYLLFSPLYLNLFGVAEIVNAAEICMLDEILMLILLSLFVFVSVLLLDWYIITYKSYNVSSKCKSSYTIILATIWLVLFSLFITTCLQCAAGISMVPLIAIIGVLYYIFFFCFVFLIHIVKCFKSVDQNAEESHLELFIVTLFFLCWLPNFSLLISFACGVRYTLDFDLFTYCIAHTYPMILFTLLYYKDRNFKICCRNLFKNERLETEMDAIETGVDRRGFKQFILLS